MSPGHVLPAGPRATASFDDAAVARVVTRISTEYVLRVFQLLIDMYGDIRAGLLVHAINIANVAHMNDRADETLQAVGATGVFPDEMRRPISVARLADSGNLPFESVRRVVQQLIADGLCERVPGGVIVPRSTIERAENLRAVLANAGYIRKFMRDLQATGLIAHVPSSLTVAASVDGTRTARLVARQSSEYLLRSVQLLADTHGGVRAGIVAQTIISANTAYLDTRNGEGWRYAGISENPPDEARRPISISRIAESLGLPYETVRRQVEKLLEANVCVRVRGGVIVPVALLESPGAVRAMLANVGYVRKLARDLDADPI
jgi:DNA-binding Lrp family transcriptional regulator